MCFVNLNMEEIVWLEKPGVLDAAQKLTWKP
jgi:hypothetical protein